MKWSEEEVELLKIFLAQGMTHSGIGNELDRTAISIKKKACSLKLKSLNNAKKTTMQYKSELPEGLDILEEYINTHTKILHRHYCGYEWKVEPSSILFMRTSCPKCAGLTRKTTDDYRNELPNGIQVMEEYINNHSKILHRHICGHEWLAPPRDILRAHGCPVCASSGFDPTIPAQLYVIEFDNNLYKIGVSSNYIKRLKHLGIPCDIVYILEFETGAEALLKEKEYLNNVNPYLLNTGKLSSGNTETFRFE